MSGQEAEGGRRDAVPTRRQRRLARVAVLSAATAAGLLLGSAGLRGLALLGVALAGLLMIVLAAGWWFLSRSGLVRVVAAVLTGVALVTVVGLLVRAGLLWAVSLSVLVWSLALAAGRAALVEGGGGRDGLDAREAPPPRNPFLIMNPWSGGGTVAALRLDLAARALGADVVLLGEPGTADVTALAEQAVVDGADLLGVAGGDGTQALVAAVAARHRLPFLVVPAGTRNHFALDLGLDRADPARALEALVDGVEATVDLGQIGDRTFVNNASFGAYAAVVSSSAYRSDKAGTALQLLPELLSEGDDAGLRVRVGPVRLTGPRAVLVSNNPYGGDDLAGLGRRSALDRGVLGVLAITVTDAWDAARLARGWRSQALWRGTATEVVVDADGDTVPVGVDGESLSLPVPVRCRIEPGALRVRLPRRGPGVRAARAAVDWRRLLGLAVPGRRR